MSKASKHPGAAAESVSPVRDTPGEAYEETVTDWVSGELLVRAVATQNAGMNDRLSLEVEITAADQRDPRLEVLITARGIYGAPDPDIQGDSRAGQDNQVLFAPDAEELVLLYRALGQAIGMAVRCGLMRLPEREDQFPTTLPDPWRALRAGSPAAPAAMALAK